jgi:hypothetical protein
MDAALNLALHHMRDGQIVTPEQDPQWTPH